MKKAWSIVKSKRPKILTFGCVAHTLNLFIKDCCREVPFFKEAVEGATLLVGTIHRSSKLLASFRVLQKLKYGKTMAYYIPGRTR